MSINILTDSTSDLGAEIVQEFGIDVIPLPVTIGGQVYLDGLEIDQDKLFDLV
jgi:fatty acid-binding protein DegV